MSTEGIAGLNKEIIKAYSTNPEKAIRIINNIRSLQNDLEKLGVASDLSISIKIN